MDAIEIIIPLVWVVLLCFLIYFIFVKNFIRIRTTAKYFINITVSYTFAFLFQMQIALVDNLKVTNDKLFYWYVNINKEIIILNILALLGLFLINKFISKRQVGNRGIENIILIMMNLIIICLGIVSSLKMIGYLPFDRVLTIIALIGSISDLWVCF